MALNLEEKAKELAGAIEDLGKNHKNASKIFDEVLNIVPAETKKELDELLKNTDVQKEAQEMFNNMKFSL